MSRDIGAPQEHPFIKETTFGTRELLCTKFTKKWICDSYDFYYNKYPQLVKQMNSTFHYLFQACSFVRSKRVVMS